MASSLSALKANFYSAAENGDVAQLREIAQIPTFAKGDIIALVAKTRRMFYANSAFGGVERLKIYEILLDLTPLKVAFDEAVQTQDSLLILAVINHFELDSDPKGLTPELNQRVLQLNFSPDMPEDYTTDDFALYGSHRRSVIGRSIKCPVRNYVGFFNS